MDSPPLDDRTTMRIALLGPLELRDSAGHPVPVTGARQRALLCRLALEPGRLVTVDRLVEDLWDAEPPAAPGNALQSAVSRLRRDLDRAGAPGREAIGSHAAGYRLDLSPAVVDLHEFRRLTSAGTAAVRAGEAEVAARLLREALALWRGPALADAGDAPFVPVAAAQADELRLSALEARVDADLALRSSPGALVTELTAVRGTYPLREGLAARLIRALVAAGRRADALAQYDTTRRYLADRLGVDPGPELREAHLAALRETVPAPAGARRGNLPAALTSFLGRDAELARLARLLETDRLITLTGPGGAGKTRLALEATAEHPPRDGAWLVELAGLPGASATAGTIADAVLTTLARPTVALEAPAADDPVARLVELLRARRLLLVLDNGEHLVEPLAALVARVLAAAPGVRALVTSREPLGVVGEVLCPVPPLPVDTTAVELFLARAAAVQPGFAGNTAEVVRICQALDGLPLAIELAAARLRSLSLAEVAARLDDRFALLGRGSRGGVARHRTLRAVMDGSWELLTRGERTLLRRLAVFAGPASLEAVDAVCAGGLPAGELPDLVGDLVDRSLVVVVDGTEGRRYRLLETVRAYASERLAEAGERAHVEAAHTAFLLDVAERNEPLLRTGEQLAAIARFQVWHADLDAATARCLATGATRAMRRLVAARLWFWWLTGQRRTAVSWATQALDSWRPSRDGAALDVATGLCLLAAAVGGGPDREAGGAPVARSAGAAAWRGEPGLLDAVTELDHPASMFATAWLAGVADLADAPGQTERPARMEAAAARFAHHPDPWCRAASRILAGHAAWDAGDADRAHAAFAAARALFTPLGERWGLLLAASSIAMVTAADEPAAALAALRESEQLAVELDGLSEIPVLLVQIGTLAGRLGDRDGAAAALDRAEGFAGDALLRARIAHARGEVARYAGELDAAAAAHRTALGLLATAEHPDAGSGRVAGADASGVAGAGLTDEPVVGPPAAVRFTAQLHSCLARVEAERGSADAAAWHARALYLSALTGDAPLRAEVLERFAAWRAPIPRCEDPDATTPERARVAAEALGAAWALRHPGATRAAVPSASEPRRTPGTPSGSADPLAEPPGVPEGVLPEAAQAREGCLAVLGDAAFAAAWRAGSTLTDPERTLGR